VVKISITDNVQRDLLSNKTNKIGFKFVRKEEFWEGRKEVELTITYPIPEEISNIWKQIKTEIESHRITKTLPIDKFSAEDMAYIENWCRLNSVPI
jgi:hypothetical protein